MSIFAVVQFDVENAGNLTQYDIIWYDIIWYYFRWYKILYFNAVIFCFLALLGESSKRTPNTRRINKDREDDDVLSPMLDFSEEFFQEAVNDKGRDKSKGKGKDKDSNSDSARNLFRRNIADDDDGEIIEMTNLL